MTAGSADQLKFNALRVCTSNDIRGNFIRLPSSIVNSLETTGIAIQDFGLEICHNGKSLLHVGWDGYESQGFLNGQPTIEINPILVQRMKLHPTATVDLFVSKYDQTRTATEVSVEPQTSDDWEIIESNALFFQDEILHQTRIVTLGETLLCYIDNIVCKFTVNKIEPTTLKSARINTGSLIVISPRENKARIQNNHAQTENKKTNKSVEAITTSHSTIKRSLYGGKEGEDRNMELYTHGNEVTSKLACVSILHSALDLKHHGKQAKQENFVKHAKRVVVTVKGRQEIPEGHVAMTPLVWDALLTSSKNGCKVIIEFIDQEQPLINMRNMKVILTSLQEDEQPMKSARRDNVPTPDWASGLIESLSKGPITDKMVLLKHKALMEIIDESTGEHVPYVNFENSPLPRCSFSVAAKAVLPNQLEGDEQDLNFRQDSMKSSYLSSGITKRLVGYLSMPVAPSSGILLTGNGGMGKTTVLKEIAREVVLKHQRYVKYIDCNSLLDSSNLGKMKQCIQEWTSQCYWYSPSILLLDNAESLFPSIKTDDPQQQAMQQRGGSNSTKLALFLIKMVEGITAKCPEAIRVVFTCHSQNELNSILFDKHFICETFKRRSPNVDERGELINFFFSRIGDHIKLGEDLPIRDIALGTDGYSPLDLQILVDKLFYQASMSIADDYVVNKEVYEETIKDFSPSSLRGVKLTKSTGISWNDIGALNGPKRILLETLEWPTKYAPIFKNCPLQLRSGILLYGYPGCGKTLLASAVAQQCGLNFITVNGPEILNKYIGASEQNVRELFDRAQSVKPCILFFDEFDSIAPKRGHDSTGVTDRIVNQLLTQMDGVEGLDGVYVLAATSRPDLIDSALLRPGRIDKSVLCNVPGLEGRLDILRAITSSGKMALEPGTDLTAVAEQTAGYSGADLQGLGYNAYLKSVHRTLQLQDIETDREDQGEVEYTVLNPNNSKIVVPESEQEDSMKPTTSTSTPVTINLQDLFQACQETKPSISTSEFRKLQAIYQKFQDDRDGDMPPGEGSTDVGTRTSLM